MHKGKKSGLWLEGSVVIIYYFMFLCRVIIIFVHVSK